MIGIFDSGLGGLTVVKEIKKRLPKKTLIYLGDTARVPYGTRSKETIRKFAREDTEFLVSKNVSLIIVACNTVSSIALDVVKKFSPVPVYGVIDPALKKSLRVTKTGRIGLVGTRATVNSNAYKEVYLRKHASLLVPLVEEGFIKGKEINLFIEKYFKDFKGKVDTLILGCTHYPIIKTEIQKYLGKGVILIDPAEELAETIYNHFQMLDKLENGKQMDKYYLTDVNERFLTTAEIFLGKDIRRDVKQMEL